MNTDQIKGRIEQAKGAVTEIAGKLVDSDKLKAEGAAEQVAGKVQATLGDVKEAVKDKAKDIINKI
jgi:uncharacterized protein YjbJ (UPF0337 family)